MNLLTSSNVIDIMERTLSYADHRLINHGKRVSYLVYKALKAQNCYTDREIRDYCVLALIHDIGAYETKVIDKIVNFETGDVWTHSVYGYLFVKNFSPFSHLAPALLFHHADVAVLEHLEPELRHLAQMIYIADRMDIIAQSGTFSPEEYEEYFRKKSGEAFLPEIIELFLDHNLHNEACAYHEDNEFISMFSYANFTSEEIDAYLYMLVYSIDFRSRATVTHTIMTRHISVRLGMILNIKEDELQKLSEGALLHDVGKNGIPLEILEKPGKLTKEEMEIMRQHVVYTENILTGCVDTDILHIAIRHHEKMDGSGYPYGLSESDLTLPEKIIAVADIFSALCGVRSYKTSFSKERTISILEGMAEDGQLNKEVVLTAVFHYDEIMIEIEKEMNQVLELYDEINEEYKTVLETVRNYT